MEGSWIWDKMSNIMHRNGRKRVQCPRLGRTCQKHFRKAKECRVKVMIAIKTWRYCTSPGEKGTLHIKSSSKHMSEIVEELVSSTEIGPGRFYISIAQLL